MRACVRACVLMFAVCSFKNYVSFIVFPPTFALDELNHSAAPRRRANGNVGWPGRPVRAVFVFVLFLVFARGLYFGLSFAGFQTNERGRKKKGC